MKKGLVVCSDIINMTKALRRCGLDTLCSNLHYEGRITINKYWIENFCCCVIIGQDFTNKDCEEIFNFISQIIPTVIINPDKNALEQTKAFLLANNCKRWDPDEQTFETAIQIAMFIPTETPVIDISESHFSVISAAIAIKALGDRAKRFVFFNQDDMEQQSVARYLYEFEKAFNAKPVCINLPSSSAAVKDNPAEEKEPYLLKIFGRSIDNQGYISTSKYDYDGLDYPIVHKWTGVWQPPYAVKSITPCSRFFDDEWDTLCQCLGLPEELMQASNELFHKSINRSN